LRFRIWYVFIVLGIIFALMSVAILFVSATAYVEEARGEEIHMDGDIGIFCCLPFLLPEAILFIALAILLWKRDKSLRDLAARLETYRIIKVSDLARKMGKSEKKARKMVLSCIKKKYIDGRMDANEETFFTTKYLANTPEVINGWKCTNCGGYNEQLLLPGEVGKCSFCEFLLDRSSKEVSRVKGEELLPPDPKKKKEKPPPPPRKIEAPAAVKDMMDKARSENK
jgi:hypothetical protein